MLAAGQSTRMGEPKLAMSIGEETILQNVVRNALTSQAKSITVVLNKDFSFLENDLEGQLINIVWNNNSNKGMSSSLKLGLESVQAYADDIMVLLADQPDISYRIMNKLFSHHIEKDFLITQAQYIDGVGHPVIFNKTLFKEILKIEGDRGGYEIIKENKRYRQLIEFNFEQPKDIDTKSEYLKYLKKEVM
ncbi:NTP transferase domain-containing protein [Salinicoccus sp. HZC-1]|uniref:nucleotidyltransferase family protein n=1 Tax=Salinicoccus sp. HZC-1 TaxID=3385497 RepID=UPI00398ACE3E